MCPLKNAFCIYTDDSKLKKNPKFLEWTLCCQGIVFTMLKKRKGSYPCRVDS